MARRVNAKPSVRRTVLPTRPPAMRGLRGSLASAQKMNNLLLPHAELWSPEEITTLQWLDANDRTTITESGGAVSQWDDKSGNDRHVLQGTGNKQPIYTPNEAVTFDGVDDWLGNSSPFMYDNGQISIFIVHELFDNAPNDIFVSEGYLPDSRPVYVPARILTPEMGASLRNNAGSFRINSQLGITLDEDVRTLSQWKDTGSEFSARRDAGIETEPIAYTRIDPVDLDVFTLGAVRLGIAEARHVGAAIHEVIICNNLSTTDKQLVEGYLAWKWGLENTLPYDHPFKNGAPLKNGTPATTANWTPSEVSTSAWFDGADTTTITEVAGSVSQWDDKSGNNNHAIETDGAKQPSTGLETINGLNVVSFDGIDDRMLFNNVSCFGKSLFAVMRKIGGNNRQILGGNGHNAQMRANGNGSVRYAAPSGSRVYTSNFSSFPNVIPIGNSGIFSLILDDISGLAGANARYSAGDGEVQAFTTGDQFGQIGARGANPLGVNFFDGDIAEIVIYDGKDQNTIDKINGYLAWKWGMHHQLPSDHPYKSVPPRL